MTLAPGIGKAVAFRPSARRTLSATMPHTGVFPWQTDGGTRDMEFERAIVAATNLHRLSIDVPPVTHDVGGCLEYSAVAKSYDMGKFMYLQHDQPGPPQRPYAASTVSDRFIESGYNPQSAWGENAAYGLQSAAAVTEAFLSDIGHRQNVEASSWRWMGVGVVRASNGLYFVTEDFGTEHDPVGGQPVPPDPPPVEQPVVVGSKWRRNTNQVVGTVTAVTPGTIFWKGKGQPVSRQPAKFRAQFTWVSG